MKTQHKLSIFILLLLCFPLVIFAFNSNSFVISGVNAQEDSSSNSPTTILQSTVFDDFNDNFINEALWTKIQVDGGTVNEKNGTLQVTTPQAPYNLTEIGYYGNWSQAGCMTNSAFLVNGSDTVFEASVNVVELDSVAEVSLMISDQKITTLDPINAENWYRLLKIKDTHYPDRHIAMVESRINGEPVSVRMEKPWIAPTGQLKIQVTNGSIAFYENGILRYQEPYLLTSNVCYVSIFTSSMGCFFGTDSFDEFAVYSPEMFPPMPTPTPNPTQTPNPTIEPTATPTPQPNSTTPTLELYCTGTAESNEFKVEITGALTQNGTALADQPILIAYSVTRGQSWESLTAVQTQTDGSFNVLWKPQVTGDYLIKVTFEGTPDLGNTSKTITLALTPDTAHNIFSLSSNSTITQFSYNLESQNLTFTAEGPSGTTGYVNIEIPKTVVSDISALKVYLDDTEVVFNIQSRQDYWLISFSYHHSSHQVTLALGDNFESTSVGALENSLLILLAISIICGVAVAAVMAFRLSRKHD